MNWFLFSLAGAACLAVTGVIDKLMLDKYARSPVAYLVALIILQQIFAVGIFAFAGSGFIYPQSLFALAAGGIQVILWASYLHALQVEEASRIAAMVFVYPVFVFLGGFFFFSETLAPGDYIGGLLLLSSALLISYRPTVRGAIISPGLKYMIYFWISAAIYALAAKYLLSFMSEWHLIMWSSLGNLAMVLPLVGIEKIREESFRYFLAGPKLFSALLANEIFDFLGRSAFIFAYALGSAALVSSVAALQPFITLTYIASLSIFMPGVLKEELDSRALALKIIAIILIIL